MKVFDEKHIKNIVLLGSAKSGKTTLAETMLFEAGLINRRGTVEDKNTVSDYHEIEHEKETSVYATPLHTEWRNYKINIIDTPAPSAAAHALQGRPKARILGQERVGRKSFVDWSILQHLPGLFCIEFLLAVAH